MTVEEIILKYQEKGVKFKVRNGKLGFTGPKGIIDIEARKEIQRYKEGIISYLQTHEGNVIVDKVNKYKDFKLTDIQSAYLVGRNKSYQYGGIGCKIYSEFDFPHLEVSRLEEAWKRVVRNNDMLHAVIKCNGVQEILKEYSIPKIKQWDMREADEETAVKHLNEVRKRLTEKQYDIDAYPLYDLEITDLKNDVTILHLSLDMLVADFTSINIIIDELEESYFNGKVPSKELSYRDVIIYKDNEKKYPKYLEKRLRDEEYWKERILTMPEGPELPKDEVDGKISIRQFNNYIDNKRCMALQNFADKNNVTLSAVILSLYAETLAYWSTEKDFCINVTMADRGYIHSDIKKVIGDFTVVDILEVKEKEDKKFKEKLYDIQRQLWTDLEHLSYTGVEVLREMTRQKKKEVVIPYVYTSTLGLAKNEENKKENKGKLLYKISQTPQVLIDCQVMEYKDGILVNWDVRENVFPLGMIEDAFESFSKLLNECDIEKLEKEKYIIELPKKTREIRNKVNSTKEEFSNQTLYKGFCENVDLYPNKEALFSNGKSFTYREVGDYSMTIKNKLIDAGIQNSDIVAIELKKGIWQLAAVLGTLLAGGTYLPINMDYPRLRRDKIEASSKAKFIITSNKNEIVINTAKVINVEELDVLKNQQVKAVLQDSEQPAYIIYTSGSTGEPKGVVISHKSAINTIHDIVKRFEITCADRVLAIADLAFDLSVFDIFGMLYVGGSIVFPNEDKDVTEWNKLINEKEVTITNTVPAQMQMLASYLEAEKEKASDKLRLMLLSGDWIPVGLPNRLYNLFSNVKLVSLGGATEGSIWSIAYEIKKEEAFERSIPYGTPLANQEFYVLDDKMQECPNWVKGRLFIGGLGLAKEYLGDSSLTEKKFIFSQKLGKRLYDTGDCGRYMPNGVIEFLGRVDHQVKIRGHRVELSEIESVLNSYKDIEESVVVVSEKNEDMINAYIQPCIEEVKEDETVLFQLEEKSRYFNSNEKFFSASVKDFKDWLYNSNHTAILDILKTFLSVGVFKDKDKWYSLDEIYSLVEVHEYYKPLIRRWLRALKTEGYVELNSNTKFKLNTSIKLEDADESWQRWSEVDKRVHYSDLMMNFFKDTRNNLLPLLRGKLDPIDLFFPKGDFKVALAAYKDNIVSRCTNEVVVNNIEILIKEFNKKYPDRKFRLLEVGAGVGGVSIDLIDRLKNYPVEYIYTDISHSFLNEAQKRFKEYPWVKYGLYDINEDYWNQNLSASSLDLILCNNVLHNANDALRVLKQFREMAVPNGSLVIIDATGNNYALLTSIEFLNGLNGVEDFRAEDEQIFLRREQWINVLKKAGIDVLSMFPEKDNELEVLGQTVFVTKFVSKRKKIEIKEVEEYLKNNLPNYMLPNNIEALEEFPLTSNGKIDRKKLQERVAGKNPFIQEEGEEAKTDLEKAVAEIWKESLKRESIWRNENFYEAGGDSLLVAQVVAKMKEEIEEAKEWEWDKLMVALIEAPTIEGLCKRLIEKREEDNGSIDKDNCIITLKKDDKSNIAKVLVHDGTGTISPYNYVIPYLKKCEGRELLALRCSDMEEYLSIDSNKLIQTLGEKYANLLMKTGKMEFELVGYCMGGLIALEIAKVLEESGMKVSSLISIDTTPSRRMLDNELLMERGFGMLIGADVNKAGHTVSDELLKKAIHELSKNHKGYISNEELLNLEGEFKPISECYRKLADKTHEERLEELYSTLSNKNGKVLGYNKERLDSLYKVFCHSFRAVISYDAGIYMGDSKVLSCKDKNTNFLPVEATDNEEFWRNTVIGNIEIIPIEGKHLTCLLPEYAEDIARILK